jgi:hypothetical protein
MHYAFHHARGLGALLALALSAALVQAAPIITKQLTGSPSTLLSLTTLTNNSWSAVGSNFNNGVGQTGDGYLFCELQGAFTFAAAPTPGTAVQVMLLRSQDGGTTFEDTSTSTVKLGRLPNVTLPVTSGQPGTKVTLEIKCPPGIFRAQALNDGTGQTITTGTISIRMLTPEGV